MILLVFYLLLALVVSFLCSIAEAVLLSVRPAYVATLVSQNKKGSKALLVTTSNLDKPLAAILTLNTIAHTIGAAGVGAQSAVVFGSAYLRATSAVLTFLILVFSEIIPKTLGAAYWKTLAPTTARLILFVMRLLYPFVWLSEKLTKLIAGPDVSAFNVSRDEVAAMAEMGVKEGVIDEKEEMIVRNLMFLHKLSIRDVMTPRSVIFSCSEHMTVQEFFTNHSTMPFSRIPIFNDTRDNFSGYVLKVDIFQAQANDEFNRPLKDFLRPLPAVKPHTSVSEAYNDFIKSRTHLAIIIDEYGTTQGLVSLEDILETIIGLEIRDELDTVEDMQLLARKRWKDRMSALGIEKDWE